MNIINVMLPIILLVFTGWSLAKAEFINTDTETYLNKIVFNLSFPAIMFISIDQYGIKNFLDLRFAISYVLSIAITFIVTFIIFKFQKKYKLADCIFIGMNASISNGGLIGMPILLGIFGVLGGATSAAMLTISSILIIPILILIIEHEVQHHKIIKLHVFGTAINKTLMQPFISATILASVLNIYSIHMPPYILKYLRYLADITVPCALIAIGIRLSNSKIGAIKGDIIVVSVLNILVKPLIALALAIAFHLPKLYSISLIVVSAAPVATTIYILSAKYNIYKSETAEISFVTMLLSMFSLPFFLWIASHYWP